MRYTPGELRFIAGPLHREEEMFKADFVILKIAHFKIENASAVLLFKMNYNLKETLDIDEIHVINLYDERD